MNIENSFTEEQIKFLTKAIFNTLSNDFNYTLSPSKKKAVMAKSLGAPNYNALLQKCSPSSHPKFSLQSVSNSLEIKREVERLKILDNLKKPAMSEIMDIDVNFMDISIFYPENNNSIQVCMDNSVFLNSLSSEELPVKIYLSHKESGSDLDSGIEISDPGNYSSWKIAFSSNDNVILKEIHESDSIRLHDIYMDYLYIKSNIINPVLKTSFNPS